MISSIRKVTCFITRARKSGAELLVFNHPGSGVQISARTAEPGENPEATDRREAAEETGLIDMLLIRL
jgi:8-oxo-dGTP pyrophosphatase MutT (NUDIX family)